MLLLGRAFSGQKRESSLLSFYSVWRNLTGNKSIGKLIKSDKSVVQDQEGISKHIVDFYQTLNKSTTPNNQHMDNYIQNTNVKKDPRQLAVR